MKQDEAENEIDESEYNIIPLTSETIKKQYKTTHLESIISIPKYLNLSVNSEIIGKIYLKPFVNLSNTPIHLEVKGYSLCTVNTKLNQTQDHSKNTTQIFQTEETLVKETPFDEKAIHQNIFMGESIEIQKEKGKKQFQYEEERKSEIDQKPSIEDQHNEKDNNQYFLEGSQVLYQIEQKTKKRLPFLQINKMYEYPIHFTLPSNLPLSIEQSIFNKIDLKIQYFIQIKMNILNDQNFDIKEEIFLKIPFEVVENAKIFPCEVLANSQKIRFYHERGSQIKEQSSSKCLKLTKCFCPSFLYNIFVKSSHEFVSEHQKYDVFNSELVIVINKNQSLFVTCRVFIDPKEQSLTINREKQQKGMNIKEVKSMTEVPHDVSVASLKYTDRRTPNQQGIQISRVKITLYGELVNYLKEQIFSKVIYLNHSNYDMLEGECMINLQDYGKFTSSRNQLFVLKYTFSLELDITTNYSNAQENGRETVYQENQNHIQDESQFNKADYFIVKEDIKDLPL